MTQLPQRAMDRWADILPRLGVDRRYLSGRHGPCPKCGGRDRWRWDNKEGRGTWFCSQCGAGDGFDLLRLVHGWDFPVAAREVEAVVGSVPAHPRRKAMPADAQIAAMRALWRASRPVAKGDAVDGWLRHRGLDLPTYPDSLRTIDSLPYHDAGQVTHHPAMLALVRSVTGEGVQLHRTYLAPGGAGKAAVPEARRLMPGAVPKGAAVRLGAPQARMGIAEGIETALAASTLFGCPIWAALTAAMLAAWEPPPEASEILVCGDNDAKLAGQAAAYALGHRLAVRGLAVSVEIPQPSGWDWNDVLVANPGAA